MDGVRWFGLQPRQEDTLPEPRDSRGMTSLKDTLIAFSGGQTVDAQLYQDNNNWRDPWLADDNASISSGSLFTGLGEMWRYGCPKKSRIGTVMWM